VRLHFMKQELQGLMVKDSSTPNYSISKDRPTVSFNVTFRYISKVVNEKTDYPYH
jgi:hypothetical protein